MPFPPFNPKWHRNGLHLNQLATDSPEIRASERACSCNAMILVLIEAHADVMLKDACIEYKEFG
jgi:hypothetical protein